MGRTKHPGVGRGRGPRSPQRVVNRVPVDEVREFVQGLVDPPAALTMEEVADIAGVSRRTVYAIMNGERKVVNPGTAEAILTARYPGRGVASRLVPTVGSMRRLQALAFYGGWSCEDIAARTGVSASTLSRIRYGRQRLCKRSTSDAVAAAYDALWDRQSTSEGMQYVMLHAYRNRWEPPAAWDDDEIDDPAARPKGTLGLRRAG